MRVLSLVPSISETLVECQVKLVGRTRFCIHPKKEMNKIKAVAGTKDINWKKVEELKPDLVIFDKEENTLEMANSCPYPYIALHITNVNNVGTELQKLSDKINNPQLLELANRWKIVSQLPARKQPFARDIPTAIPAVIESIANPINPMEPSNIRYIDYLIWKEPWMAIGPNTFIWSMLEKLGLANFLIKRENKYPNLGEKLTDISHTFFLFSSEPFPFKRYKEQLIKEGLNGVVIDGESYSWYGLRSLKFLETQLN